MCDKSFAHISVLSKALELSLSHVVYLFETFPASSNDGEGSGG